jgi:hypothetical protein
MTAPQTIIYAILERLAPLDMPSTAERVLACDPLRAPLPEAVPERRPKSTAAIRVRGSPLVIERLPKDRPLARPSKPRYLIIETLQCGRLFLAAERAPSQPPV